MTRRRTRYLREYPGRIACKRLKRRRMLRSRREPSRMSMSTLRKALQDYVSSRPTTERVRAGRKRWFDPITRIFRKPTV